MLHNGTTFYTILHVILSCRRSTLPSRVSSFLTRVLEETGHKNIAVVEDIANYLLQFMVSKSVWCRRHSLRLACLIIQTNRKIALSSDVVQFISERLFDRDTGVRKEAVKICLLFQDFVLNNSLVMHNVLKDVLRYDQSPAIRKILLEGIKQTESTVNAIVERCIDTDISVRKSFWDVCFKQLDVRTLPHPQRIFLMKSSYSEREFDAKSTFTKFVTGFGIEEFAELFFCNEPVYDYYIDELLRMGDYSLGMTTFTSGYIHLLGAFYRYVEERDGRDCLVLMELEELLQLIYTRSSELEAKIESLVAVATPVDDLVSDRISEEYKEEIAVVVGLFNLLSFYDIFENGSKRIVLKIINSLLIKCSVKAIIEESVLLCKRICSVDLIPFIGSIIKKTKGTPVCFALCASVMRHLPFGDMHSAIIHEIAVPNLAKSLDILFWYFVAKPSEEAGQFYLSFLPNWKVVEGATDLVISGLMSVEMIYDALHYQISAFNENVVIPLTKLLLAGQVRDSLFYKNLLLMFYSTNTPRIQQHLFLFFTECFSSDASPLIDTFCDITELITNNHKIFVDQSLFWISNSKLPRGTQILFYRISLYIINNYSQLKGRKWLFSALEQICVLPCWHALLTKKIIYVISLIIKKRPREGVQALLLRLMAIDDGAPLDPEEFTALRAEINDDE